MDAEAMRHGPRAEHVAWQADTSGVVIRMFIYDENGKATGAAWLGISTSQLAQYEDAIAGEILIEGQGTLW